MMLNDKISNCQIVEFAIKRCYTFSFSELFYVVFTFNQLVPGHFSLSNVSNLLN